MGEAGPGSDTDSDSEDDENLARLREAVDSETLKETFFQEIDYPVASNAVKDVKDNPSESPAEDVSLAPDSPAALCRDIKAVLQRLTVAGQMRRAWAVQGESLRRDKQAQECQVLTQELQVTPGFQQFVAGQLGSMLDTSYSEVDTAVAGAGEEDQLPEKGAEQLRLLRSSRVPLTAGLDQAGGGRVPRGRPALLPSHRTAFPPSQQELLHCAVTAEFVLSGAETVAWVNKFPTRVEPGVERIKKKKKKVNKTKKKKKAGENGG